MQQDPKRRFESEIDRFEQRDRNPAVEENLGIQGEDDDEEADGLLTGADGDARLQQSSSLDDELDDDFEDEEEDDIPLPDEATNRGLRGGGI